MSQCTESILECGLVIPDPTTTIFLVDPEGRQLIDPEGRPLIYEP